MAKNMWFSLQLSYLLDVVVKTEKEKKKEKNLV